MTLSLSSGLRVRRLAANGEKTVIWLGVFFCVKKPLTMVPDCSNLLCGSAAVFVSCRAEDQLNTGLAS